MNGGRGRNQEGKFERAGGTIPGGNELGREKVTVSKTTSGDVGNKRKNEMRAGGGVMRKWMRPGVVPGRRMNEGGRRNQAKEWMRTVRGNRKGNERVGESTRKKNEWGWQKMPGRSMIKGEEKKTERRMNGERESARKEK
jgi:hypothetical protein